MTFLLQKRAQLVVGGRLAFLRPSPSPFMHTHSATTLTSKICSQARQAIIWTWALEAATATRRNAEKD